jgi:hypothetical protein
MRVLQDKLLKPDLFYNRYNRKISAVNTIAGHFGHEDLVKNRLFIKNYENVKISVLEQAVELPKLQLKS